MITWSEGVGGMYAARRIIAVIAALAAPAAAAAVIAAGIPWRVSAEITRHSAR